jgi:hypothetical protein
LVASSGFRRRIAPSTWLKGIPGTIERPPHNVNTPFD